MLCDMSCIEPVEEDEKDEKENVKPEATAKPGEKKMKVTMTK